MPRQRVKFLLIFTLFASLQQVFADTNKDNNAVNISAIRAELIFLTDGGGHYIAVRAKTKGPRVLYYGDGTIFYRQRTFSGGFDAKKVNPEFSWFYWAPRTLTGNGSLTLKNNKWTVQCDARKTTMTKMKPAVIRKLFSKAVFKKPLWKRKAHALARDDLGTYYYVDRLDDDHGSKGFRVYVGKLGNLKKRQMTNIVSDTRGEIFVTRSGRLRLLLDPHEAIWSRRGRDKKLRTVSIGQNKRMIYRDLGVYEGPLGTPCDQL